MFISVIIRLLRKLKLRPVNLSLLISQDFGEGGEGGWYPAYSPSRRATNKVAIPASNELASSEVK